MLRFVSARAEDEATRTEGTAGGPPRRGMSPRDVLRVSLVSLGLCAGVVVVAGGLHTTKPPARPAAEQAFRMPVPAPATPARVRIPAIGVSAPVSGLTLDGTSPGVVGTAVITGDATAHQGPATFHDLGALKRGDTVSVDRTDGRSVVFTIDAVEAYDARAFPRDKVYGASARAELRLVTRGAGFGKGHDCVVVYAHRTG